MNEKAGDALERVIREVEIRQELVTKSDREIADIIEVALANFEMDSEALVAVLETASYRLQRANGGPTPAPNAPHTFEPFKGSTDMCWVCGDLADHEVHQSKEAEGGAEATRTSLARGVTSCETPSASDVRTAVSSVLDALTKRGM